MQPWIQALRIIAYLEVGWIVYDIICRLFLTPLALIPGPKLAALTSWYEFYYDVIRPGKFVWKIQELHKEYGPIVRITPWEIHINDVEFLNEIYASSARKRNKYEFQLRTLPVPLSIGGTGEHDLHRKRREALNPFFSKKSIIEFESIVTAKVRGLCQLFDEHLERERPINLSDVHFAFALDVVSHYSFGHDDDVLSSEVRAAKLRANTLQLLLGSKVNQHFPWIVEILDLLPLAITKSIMPPGVLDMLEFSTRIRSEIQQIFKDPTSNPSRHSIFHTLHEDSSLSTSEKSLVRLQHEATLLVMAGTASPAQSLSIAHFHLLHNPNLMATLRAELRSLPPTASWAVLEQLPYLSAIIAEANRLSFGVTARVCRVAPDEALQYGDYIIPPGTPVSTTTLAVHTDERIFPDPWAFQPERWLGEEGKERRKYLMAFGKGSRSCIGVHLAHAELFLAVAAVARYDMELFETGVDDVSFRHDYHVAFPKPGSKGVRAMVKGKIG
ncbi:hypothetical protein MMC13_007719 [Lambiella insularis]|nr:hypothetical protein [Lambiella insularis]